MYIIFLMIVLYNEYSVIVGEEVVFFFDGLFVSFYDQIVFVKGIYYNYQVGFGQVEVGDYCIWDVKFIRWINKQIGLFFGFFEYVFGRNG